MAKRDYSLKTEKLINRMCACVERENFILDKKSAEECILKTYDLFKLDRPKKIVWVKDIFDKKFQSSAGSARSIGVGWTALDDDFWDYIFEFEYCENPDKEYPINENDIKYKEYSELLLQALEFGAGYRVEWEDTLYIAPIPLVKLDQENRYHSLGAPAIRWKGGHEFYYVHGVNVKKDIILHPEKLTKKDWLNEGNLEIRRIIQEQMGDSFPKKIGSKLIGKPSKEYKDKHKLSGLYEVELPNDPEKIAHYIRVKDHSSSREYYLRVNPTITDCDEALAWTFGKTKETYNPLQET